MGDDWDPLADLPEEAAQAPGTEGTDELVPIAGCDTKITNRDLTRIIKDIHRKLEKESPWKVMPDSKPDLSWHKPTCTLEDWKHTDIKVQIATGIAYITLNRPDDNNALSDGMVAGLCDAIILLHGREDIRVAVFTGEGKMFSCGRDPKGDAFGCKVASIGTGESHPDAKEALDCGAFPDGKVNMSRLTSAKMWNAWATLPQFTICLANGSAMGEGLGGIVCCDMAIGLKTSFYGFPDTKLGCVNAMVSPYILQKCNANLAKKMFVLSQLLTADQALEYKLLNKVVDSVADGHKVVKEMCDEVTKCGPQSVKFAKEIVLAVAGRQVNDTLVVYTAAMAEKVAASEEAKAGLAATKSKSPKPWESKPIVPLH